MCLTPDREDHARSLAGRLEILGRWIADDVTAGSLDRAESNAVAAIDLAAELRELSGTMAAGHTRVATLIGA